jgi:hypothetical protein
MKVPIAFHRLVSRLVACFRRRSHMTAFVPLVDDQGREVGLWVVRTKAERRRYARPRCSAV